MAAVRARPPIDGAAAWRSPLSRRMRCPACRERRPGFIRNATLHIRHAFNVLAPRITPSAACQDNVCASLRRNPRARAAVSVAPLRDTPGSVPGPGESERQPVTWAGFILPACSPPGRKCRRAPSRRLLRSGPPRLSVARRAAARSVARARNRRAPEVPATNAIVPPRRRFNRSTPSSSSVRMSIASAAPAPACRTTSKDLRNSGSSSRRASLRATGSGSCGRRRRPAAARSGPAAGQVPARGGERAVRATPSRGSTRVGGRVGIGPRPAPALGASSGRRSAIGHRAAGARSRRRPRGRSARGSRSRRTEKPLRTLVQSPPTACPASASASTPGDRPDQRERGEAPEGHPRDAPRAARRRRGSAAPSARTDDRLPKALKQRSARSICVGPMCTR